MTEFLKFYFIKQGSGIRNYVAKVVKGKSKKVIYEKNGFILYVAGRGELRINLKRHGRSLRRFLRDFTKHSGGLPRSLSYYFTPHL